MSEQDESDAALGSSGQNGRYLARSGLPAVPRRNLKKTMFFPYHKSFIDEVCSAKMAGYCSRPCLRVYGRRWNRGS